MRWVLKNFSKTIKMDMTAYKKMRAEGVRVASMVL